MACGSGTTTVKPVGTPSAGSTVPSAQPSNAVLNAKFGQTYQLHYVNDYDFKRSGAPPVYVDYSVLVNAPTITRGALSQYGSPPSHGYYVVFRATIAAGPQTVSYNVMNFAVRDAANESTRCGTGEDTLNTGTLHAEQQASGTVICDVAVVHGTLVFDPTRVEDSGSLVEWKF